MKIIRLILMLLCPFSLQAEVYKWVDAEGMVHYGDKPQNNEAVKVRVDAAPTAVTSDKEARDEMRQRVTDSLQEDRLAKQEERQKKKQERDKKLKECNWLRDRQKRLQTASGIYKLDKEGNRVFMSDDSRKKTEQDLERKIKQACS